MAVLIMAHNKNTSETNPIFHDFLGNTCASNSPIVVVTKNGGLGREIKQSEASSASFGASSGGHGLVSATSDLGSERQMGNHLEGVPFYGLKNNFSEPEISNRFLGRKRSSLDSGSTLSPRDKIPQMGLESLDNSHLMKILRNESGGNRRIMSHNNESFFDMQPPRTNSTVILQSPTGNRPNSIASKWEQSMAMNLGPVVQYPPRPGHFVPYIDKVSSNRPRDTNAGPSHISQPAADEGSRTGIKGSGILSAINASGGAPEKNPSCMLPSSSRQRSGPYVSDPESSNPSQHGLTSPTRQMTIFYAGQAHVFDDVNPNKAEAIMSLAGSNGGSWSTTYSSKSNVRPPSTEYMHKGENETGVSLVLTQELRGRLSTQSSFSHRNGPGAQISTTPDDPLNLSSGGHVHGLVIRDTRTSCKPVEPNTEGKKEVP